LRAVVQTCSANKPCGDAIDPGEQRLINPHPLWAWRQPR